ncbi:MAG TPA: hypothetical protein VM324_00485 [Egibacteraceae bacterium]|nr:hypothetical protein [Egibacteraceae bacterium]
MPVFRMVTLAFAKTFSKLFGLATITFFGRAPSRDDDKVGLVGLLSLTWLSVVVAAFVPALAEILLPFLPDDERLLRGVMIAGSVAIPPLVGVVITRMENRRDDVRSVAREALCGYGYAAGIGMLVVALVLVVPLIKVSYIFRRFDLKHIAVMISPDDYDAVLEEIREALDRHGIATEVRDPERPVLWIFRGLVFVEGKIFRRDMSRRMKVVSGHLDDDERRWFEITVHATDISVIGRKEETSCVMALLSEELDERNVYFSWDDSSQALEDRILAYGQALDTGEDVDPDVARALCAELRELALSTEEWNAIRRQIYKLERDCYRARAERCAAEHDPPSRLRASG